MTIEASSWPDDDAKIRVVQPSYSDIRLTVGDVSLYLSRTQAYRILSALENELSRRREADLDENRERLAYEHKYDEAAGDGPRQEPPWMDPDLSFAQDLEDQMREDLYREKDEEIVGSLRALHGVERSDG